MDNFKIIYKILKSLEQALDYDEFDEESISPELLKVTEQRYNAIMAMLAKEGYIEGVSVKRMLGDCYPQIAVRNIRITLKGLEYLNENSLMKKAASLAKGVVELLP